MENKVTKVPKMHGGHSMETGPGKNKPHDFQHVEKHGPKPSLATGPAAIPGKSGGNKSKGTMTSGTKGDQKGEDSGGSAKG